MANERFQNAIARRPQKTPPIWMMRQAGRYHKHYQAMKEKHSFMELCKQPELAAEVAFGPVNEFDFDLAILFSDLLFPLEALGFGLDYKPGPVLSFHLEDESDLNKLKSVDEALPFLHFQKEAVQLTRERIPRDKSVIGFVGGPWTLFSYASAGDHGGHLIFPKTNRKLCHRFFELITPLLIKNIALQLEGGAEVVMVLDTSAGELGPLDFNELVLPSLRDIAARYPGQLGYYARRTTEAHLDQVRSINDLGGVGVDHRFSMSRVLGTAKHGFVQGNFDQTLLFQKRDDFEKSLRAYLEPMQALGMDERAGWVCGLGHGILPRTPEENVRRFVEIVREVFQ